MTLARGTVRGSIAAVLAAVTLAGCSSSAGAGDESPGGPAVSSAPAKAAAEAGADKAGADKTGAGAEATKVAEKGGRIGGAGSACELPVTFDIAAQWKPRGTSMGLDPELAEELAEELADLTEQGTVKVVCEVDAKPAGNIGFLRVWQGEASEDDPRAVLKAFVADDPNASEAAYTRVTAGAVEAAEVGYTVYSDLMDESKDERAFAVATPDGPVVVHLGGLDSEEHAQMLPAFELAKKTLKLG